MSPLRRKVISINRRAWIARLDDGTEIPIVEAYDDRGRFTDSLRKAHTAIARHDSGVLFEIWLEHFPWRQPS